MSSTRLLNHYIYTTLIISWLMVMFVLLGLNAIFSYIDQISELKNDYQLFQAFVYVMATFPESAFEFMSMAMLLACLIGLGQMASSSEIIIMRACGISVIGILWTVLKPVLIIIALALLMAEYGVPKSSQFAESYRAEKRGESEFRSLQSGHWQREGNRFVYINRVNTDGKLHGVTVFEFNEKRELQRMHDFRNAQESEGQGEWETEGVRTTIIKDNAVVLERDNRGIWKSDITFNVLRMLMVSPDKLSISALYHYGQYVEQQEQNASKYFLAFWKKIFLPLSTIAMVLIAASFVFGSLRETPMGSRLLIGIVIAMVFNQIQTFSSHAAMVYDITPVIAASLPALAALLIGIILVKRAA